MSHTKAAALSTYRSLFRLIKAIPSETRKDTFLSQLQTTFRAHATETDLEKIRLLLQTAGEKIAYLRIITPKKRGRSNGKEILQSASKRWVYTKDGVEEIGSLDASPGTPNRASGRVVSNWDGKNLDPCSVKRHFQGLQRAGFQNNLHAKGIF